MSAPAVRRVILGTAGHIDHGKTALVARLTGTQTDSLPEEQARGMTIDVGYAAFVLPDGTEAGLLDVPGHERLVRTMVAAATAMDLALLVVAADDGPMPQTREHVEILDVLGITRLVVALTKTDLVDEETCLIAEEEIGELLAGTGMAGASILRVSSETGAGIDALKTAINDAIPKADPDGGAGAAPLRVFRMPVLRGFLVKGRGAVVTGIPISGAIEDGGRAEVMPQRWASRVRGVQVHHRDSDAARAGQRTALALADIRVDKVKRGMVVVAEGALAPVHRVAVWLRLLDDARRDVEHGSRARLHLGADQLVVRVHLPLDRSVAPGGEALAELQSDKPFVAIPGDRFVLRMENAQGTLGGGVVLEALERRMRKSDAERNRVAHEMGEALFEPLALVETMLLRDGEQGADVPRLVARTGLRADVVTSMLGRLQGGGKARPIGRGGRFVSGAAFDRVRERLVKAVVRLHEKDEALDSLSLAVVRSAVGRLEPAVFDAALEVEIQAETLVRTPSGQIHHAEHSQELPPKERARCERIAALLAEHKGRPPAIEDLVGLLAMSKPELLRSLRLMESRQLAFRADTWWFDGAFIEQGKARLRTLAEAQGGFTPADARGVFDTTRKWVIPLLEALDKSGFSRRAGDKRVLRT